MQEYQLSPQDLRQLTALVDDWAADNHKLELDGTLDELALAAISGIPAGLRSFVERCRLAEAPLLRITGWPVDDAALGGTPQHWREPLTEPARRHQLALLLVASLLGDVFSFAAVQDGHIVSHVLPMRGSESTVTAGSSEVELDWHTEGAGLDTRPHHQVFLCLRNPDRVPTLVADLAADTLPADTLRILREPRFRMPALGPDGKIEVTMAAVSGSDDRPYLRLDPVYLRGLDPAAVAALETANAVIRSRLRPFHQSPGDLYAIDNYRLVHGRPAFTPRYDGTDRWLMRVKTTRDLRASAGYRSGPDSRLVRLYR